MLSVDTVSQEVESYNFDQSRPFPVLPARYYLDHFNEFINAIESTYGHVLVSEHQQFISDFRRLSSDAQCLYVRMLNRRGRIFDSRRFNYAEISHIPKHLEQLQTTGFIRMAGNQDFPAWLQVINRQTLLEIAAQQLSADRFRRSWPKAQLVELALTSLNRRHQTVIAELGHYVVQERYQQAGFLLFLYFGRYEEDLSRFTLRDLGVMRTNGIKRTFSARFDDRESALSSWFYCQKLSALNRLKPEDCFQIAEDLPAWPQSVGENSDSLRQQAIYRLGEKLEKGGSAADAERVYRYANGWPASERLVRLLYTKGEKPQVQTMLENMIDNPDCEEELIFARDFHARKFEKKRTSRLTDILRDSKVIPLDESWRDSPEAGAIAWFRRQGAEAYYSENRLWRRLFGLLFWELLFEHQNSAIHNDFEKRPQDLDSGEFYQKFRTEIEQILAGLTDVRQVMRKLLATVTRCYGRPNGIFRWHPDILDELSALLPAINAEPMMIMLRRIATDYSSNHSGFPDLLVIKNQSARFVEIKAEGDQLRRNQLKQIIALEQAGISVEVNRVEWMVDPEQVYVVVDIETTGRRSNSNRITEIGVVKLCNNEVIDRWETLLNPERSIPRNITQLTGISEGMIADAPRFLDIADSFEEFTAGAVFVAHNVRFDYPFICDEFRRLGRDYQRPTLCSCVEMRKWYPGHRSYSLANLCAAFNISLESHHRALCDAEAAAQLLLLINQKRIQTHQS